MRQAQARLWRVLTHATSMRRRWTKDHAPTLHSATQQLQQQPGFKTVNHHRNRINSARLRSHDGLPGELPPASPLPAKSPSFETSPSHIPQVRVFALSRKVDKQSAPAATLLSAAEAHCSADDVSQVTPAKKPSASPATVSSRSRQVSLRCVLLHTPPAARLLARLLGSLA